MMFSGAKGASRIQEGSSTRDKPGARGGGGWADVMVPFIPPPEGWAFPGAPAFVRQGSYQFEFDCYTGR